jgi:Transposase DDE domain
MPLGGRVSGNQWQSKNSDAFDTDAFAIDWDTLTAICPQGHRNTWSGTGTDRHGKPRVMFTFSMTDCTPCPVRSRCTRAKTAARTITLRPREQHELLRNLRADQQTEQWRKRYAARSGIEGATSQAVRAFDLRRCRYLSALMEFLHELVIRSRNSPSCRSSWTGWSLVVRNTVLTGDSPKRQRGEGASISVRTLQLGSWSVADGCCSSSAGGIL